MNFLRNNTKVKKLDGKLITGEEEGREEEES